MAKVKGKGTAIKVDISSVMTAISQVISITPPAIASLDYDSTTLDTSGAGKERELTGYAESDAFSAELFWDPALAVHDFLYDSINTPVETTWNMVFVDSGDAELDWTTTGLKFAPVVAMNDGLKATVTGEVDQIPVITQ